MDLQAPLDLRTDLQVLLHALPQRRQLVFRRADRQTGMGQRVESFPIIPNLDIPQGPVDQGKFTSSLPNTIGARTESVRIGPGARGGIRRFSGRPLRWVALFSPLRSRSRQTSSRIHSPS